MKSWCVHMQIKQVPGVESQGVLMLSQIADPYVAQVVAQKQLVLLPMLQPPVNTNHLDHIKISNSQKQLAKASTILHVLIIKCKIYLPMNIFCM